MFKLPFLIKGKAYDAIFLDFDGVILESLNAKGEAFVELFSEQPKLLLEKILNHHLKNGSLPRSKKIPIYMKWAGLTHSREYQRELENKFSEIVFDKVLKSDWVCGVQEFLAASSSLVPIFLITATPKCEIERVLERLSIDQYFVSVHGFPENKIEALNFVITSWKLNPHRCVFFGDTREDFRAATANDMDFILRKTDHNSDMFVVCQPNMIDNFQFDWAQRNCCNAKDKG